MGKMKYAPICARTPLFSTDRIWVVLQTLISIPGAFHWLVSDMNYEPMVSEQDDDSPSAITTQLRDCKAKHDAATHHNSLTFDSFAMNIEVRF